MPVSKREEKILQHKVAGIVLAAGASTRMGRPKQLLAIGGQNLLDCVLGEALKSDLDHVALVLGYEIAKIKSALTTDLHHPRLRILENRQYRDGISTSIITGLDEVESCYDYSMIILADMPYITAALMNRLIQDYLASGRPLGAIKIGDRRSHPVIIGRTFYHEVHRLHGDRGARELFAGYPEQVFLMETAARHFAVDMDTPADYEELQAGAIKY